MSKHRLNYPEADQYSQTNADALCDLAYALGAVIGAGCFGAMLAYVIWGFR